MNILHVGSSIDLSGGIESFLMNIYRNLDETKVVFDFIVKEEQKDGYYREFIIKKGGQIYTVEEDTVSFRTFREKYKIYKLYRGGIVQIHTNCGSRVFDGMIAKLAGVKNVIFHCHTCKGKANLKFKILQPLFRILGDYFWACSEAAACFFFGNSILNNKNYSLIHNAIEMEKYIFNEAARLNVRDREGWSRNYVLGIVGRLSYEKNICFAIDVIYELKKMEPCWKLVIVGKGDESERIREYIESRKLEDSVYMLGEKDNVHEYLSAFDMFILPSYYEGLGIVLIEAQVAGLMCFASNRVPQETKITSNIRYLPLEEPAKKWADEIIKNVSYQRKVDLPILKQSGYSCKEEAQTILKMYEKMDLKVK